MDDHDRIRLPLQVASQAVQFRDHTLEHCPGRRKMCAERSQAALATLCQTYWYPVYAFIRRRGYSVIDAQDVTQDFFATLLEKDYVQAADREKGRFRTFLLTAVTRFLSKQRDRQRTAKRGGDRRRTFFRSRHRGGTISVGTGRTVDPGEALRSAGR